jgi:hypothetical protein
VFIGIEQRLAYRAAPAHGQRDHQRADFASLGEWFTTLRNRRGSGLHAPRREIRKQDARRV